MAFNNDLLQELGVSKIFAIGIRLPLQFILIAIAYWQRKV